MFKAIHILVDSREKAGHVWLFPKNLRFDYGGASHTIRVVTGVRRLPEGDYTEPDSDPTTGFERKASIRELYCNLLGTDREITRARDAFERFAARFYPAILVVTVPPIAFTERKFDSVLGLTVDGGLVFDALTKLVHDLQVSLWITGTCKTVAQRRAMGTLVARTLLQDRLRREGYYDDASI